MLLLSLMDVRALAHRRRTEKLRAESERVRRLAYYDAVTELPNRSLFNETLLRQLIAINGKAPPPFGIIYGELREYRALVERLGQDRVNLIMKSLARHLSQGLLEGDVLARLSRESFVFLMREHADRSRRSGHGAGHRPVSARRCRARAQRCGLVWGVGSSRYPEGGTSTQALIRAAMKLQREVGAEARSALQQKTVSALGAA